MNSILFILLLSKGVYGEACFIPLLKTEVSKVDYASKATAVRVRGVSTFFYTCLSLGQLSPHKFKKLHIHLQLLTYFLRPVLNST
jgi:hypothetical protein